MKTMKIYEHGTSKPRHKPRLRIIRTGLAIVTAFGIGVYIGNTTPWADTIKADTADTYVVQDGETLWSIARPIADDRGEDIREAVARIMADNGIKADAVIRPGQKIVIK